jgi:small subunit ribosomal protein S9
MTTKRQFHFATGKRKTAIARVKLFEAGSGEVTINGEPMKKYFFGILPEKVVSPLTMTNRKNSFDIEAKVMGGGKHGQAEAVRAGVSKALLLYDPSVRITLKKAGFLRRDSRIRERKKPGLHRARRAPQFAKR